MQDTDRYRAGRLFRFVAWMNIIMGLGVQILFVYPLLGSGAQQNTIWLALIGSMILVLAIALVLFLVGGALKRGEPWARVVGLVLAALMLLSFPIGTVFGALLLYFLIRDRGVPADPAL
jgi:hypothetical protein